MLSLTLVALSRGQTLWLETDMRGASAEGACKRYVAWPSSDMQSLPQSPHSGQQPPPPCRGHLGSPIPMFFCSPNEGFSSTTSPLLPGHFGKLCSTSYSQHRWGVRNGTKGLIWGLLHCNQMRLLRGEEKEEVEYYVLSCIPLQHCCFFVFVRADFDAVSPYLCSPGSHVS